MDLKIQIFCLLALSCCCTAQFCKYFERDGECVNAVLPCPEGKVQSAVYTCGKPDLNCCHTPDTPPQPPQPVCGEKKTLRPTSRIFNGNNVDSACRWPWVVSIRSRADGVGPLDTSGTTNLCTGVLVSPDTVLTSAFCLHMASVLNNNQQAAPNLLVVAGDYNIETEDISRPVPRERYHKVSRTTIHPGNYRDDETTATLSDLNGADEYVKKGFNIGVIKLERSVELGECRELACLPSVSETVEDTTIHKCYIASYGTYNESQDLSTVLKEASVDLYPAFTCDLIFHPFKRPYGTTCGRFVQSFYPTGLCQGDDGGMVVCQDAVTNKWKLLGLIDFPKFKQCESTNNIDPITFSDLRDPNVWFWLESQL